MQHCFADNMIDRKLYIIVIVIVRSMWETTVMHKQVSGWTVNFGPNFPEYPFLELKTRIPPPPPFWKTSDLGWPKFTLEYPLPISENFRFGMAKVYSGIPPRHFRKLQIWDGQSLLWNTPPPFQKTSDLGWQSLLRNTPPHFGKLQIWDDKVYSGIPGMKIVRESKSEIFRIPRVTTCGDFIQPG